MAGSIHAVRTGRNLAAGSDEEEDEGAPSGPAAHAPLALTDQVTGDQSLQQQRRCATCGAVRPICGTSARGGFVCVCKGSAMGH